MNRITLTDAQVQALCRAGYRLREIAALAGVTRQAIHNWLKRNEPRLIALRNAAAERKLDDVRWQRWLRGTTGAKLRWAEAQLAEHCPDLPTEWRAKPLRSEHSWELLCAGLPVTVYRSRRPKRHGGNRAWGSPPYVAYVANVNRAGRAVLFAAGDGRVWLYLSPPRGTVIWQEASPPWRGLLAVLPHHEWRVADASDRKSGRAA